MEIEYFKVYKDNLYGHKCENTPKVTIMVVNITIDSYEKALEFRICFLN